MGPKRRLRRPRTVAAAILTAFAIAVPCGTWLVAGGRQLDAQAELQAKFVTQQFQKKALILSDRLANRLSAVRESESRRPFYQYQNLYHDPNAAAEGASVSISPLAGGAPDPLIEAYFQIDEFGRISLPTLNDQFPDLGLHASEDEQCRLLAELEPIVGAWGSFESAEIEPVAVDRIELRAWQLHLHANEIYGNLKYGRRTEGPTIASAAKSGRVEVVTGPLKWETTLVGLRPAMLAVRAVDTPSGRWTQGFVIAQSVVDGMLRDTSVAIELVAEVADDGLVIPVAGTPWSLAIDLTAPLAEEKADHADQVASFNRVFVAGLLAASLAGLLAVVLVHQAERLASERARFAAAAAHELRTPLAGLRLYGEMLGEGLGQPERARSYARRIAAEVERLGRVVTNVLSFTRLERGLATVDLRMGDLGEIAREVVDRLRPVIEETGTKLDLDLEEDLPPALFDREAVSHILQNLLDNAERYTRNTENRVISVRTRAPRGGRVEIIVEDNGDGVPSSLRRRMFRPFSRGEHSNGDEGLGLGLALVKLLTESQNGSVVYRDATGGGARFEVSFPSAVGSDSLELSPFR